MGARGRTAQYGNRIVVRFPRDMEAQLRILARTEGVDSISGFIRELVAEGLRNRKPRPKKMSKTDRAVEAATVALAELRRLFNQAGTDRLPTSENPAPEIQPVSQTVRARSPLAISPSKRYRVKSTGEIISGDELLRRRMDAINRRNHAAFLAATGNYERKANAQAR